MQIPKVLFGMVTLILLAEKLMLLHRSLPFECMCWEEVLRGRNILIVFPEHYVLRLQIGFYNVNLFSLAKKKSFLTDHELNLLKPWILYFFIYIFFFFG